jgi:hypothetical protein
MFSWEGSLSVRLVLEGRTQVADPPAAMREAGVGYKCKGAGRELREGIADLGA